MKKNGENPTRKQAPTPEERVVAALEVFLEPLSDEEIEARLKVANKNFAKKYGDAESPSGSPTKPAGTRPR